MMPGPAGDLVLADVVSVHPAPNGFAVDAGALVDLPDPLGSA